MKSVKQKTDQAAVRADILRSVVASCRIEKIVITPEQATAVRQRVEATLAKSPR
ncbi:hypothetical protein GCM10023187_38260 [Nibrella viscosa]|uniref:Uncharacterized protein n=1 Tax=Nibrella viscosa TaxID=1084524 RepID=A0ABP8KQJ0_9BACT